MRVLFFGASRGCGLYAALDLLKSGSTCIFLLRKPSALTDSPDFKALSDEDRARAIVVQGDAFVTEDVEKAFKEAGNELDAVVYSIGGVPNFALSPFGFVVTPRDVCERSIATILPVIKRHQSSISPPKKLRMVIVSSMGLGKKGHKNLALPMKPLYAMIAQPHEDKEALELLACKAASLPLPDYPKTHQRIASSLLNAVEPIPELDLIIIHPAFYTDGNPKGIEHIRTAESEQGFYTISRKDVGLFIPTCIGEKGDQWVGKSVVIGY